MFYINTEWKEENINGRVEVIPEDWCVEKLRNLFKVPKLTIAKEGTCPYLEIGDINNFKYKLKNKPSVKGAKFVKNHIIVISTVRPNLRKITFVQDINISISSAFAVFDGYNKFIYFYILTENFNNDILKLTKGIGYPTVKKEYIYDLKMSAPKILNEQTKIRDFLESNLEKIDNLIKKIDNLIKKIDNFNY